MHVSSWVSKVTGMGVYPKLTAGFSWYFLSVARYIYAIFGLGGAGMTIIFGITEKLIFPICYNIKQ